MKTAKLFNDGVFRLILLVMVVFGCSMAATADALEQHFDKVQIGTTLYRNVTVTTKNKNYIFILHSAGMTNIKVSDLPPELLVELGYDNPAASQVKTNTTAAWARQILSKMEVPQVQQLKEKAGGWLHLQQPNLRLPQLSQQALMLCGAGLLLFYLFHSFCCMLICKKSGSEPGALIWVPLLQLFPLLKAARMSAWWFLGFLLPGVNLVAQVLWCFKITDARGKGFGVALLLILPISSPFAALYLAFSGGDAPRKSEGRVEIMTLEAA
jgi:hypothetical protein